MQLEMWDRTGERQGAGSELVLPRKDGRLELWLPFQLCQCVSSMWKQAVLDCWQYPVQAMKDILQMSDHFSLGI